MIRTGRWQRASRLGVTVLGAMLLARAPVAASPSGDTEESILAQLARAGGAAPRLPVFTRLTPALRPRPLGEAAEAVAPLVEEAAARHGIDPGFFRRLIGRESGFNANAVSRAGAQGIAQFMPNTAASVGLDDPFDPVKALPKSAEHLRSLHDRLGNEGLAAAAYNAGEGRVRAWLAGRSGLPAETVSYVRSITGRAVTEWVPAGAAPGPLGVAERGPAIRLPAFARMGSPEWQLGASLLGGGKARLAALLDAAPRPAPRASSRSARPETGEQQLCRALGCVVATRY